MGQAKAGDGPNKDEIRTKQPVNHIQETRFRAHKEIKGVIFVQKRNCETKMGRCQARIGR